MIIKNTTFYSFFKCIVSLFFIFLTPYAFATFTGANVTYNNSWNPTGPAINQTNNFSDSTNGISAALDITAGTADLSGSANTIGTSSTSGNLTISGSTTTAYFGSNSSANSSVNNASNTIYGSVTITDGTADFSNNGSSSGTTVNGISGIAVANTISGGLTVSGGSANFSNTGSNTGGVLSTISGGINVSGGAQTYFSNFSTGNGSMYNTLSGGVRITGGSSVDLSNPAGGSMTNTITGGMTIGANSADTGNTLILGGGGSTTTIDTLNFNNGTLQFMYANDSFGSTTINTLNLGTGSLTLELVDNNQSQLSLVPTITSTKTLFTVGTVTGDASQITLINSSPFTEIIATTGSSNGVTLSSDGTVTVTMVSTATTTELDASSAMDALTDAASTVQVIAAAVSDASFAFITKTPYERAAANARIARTMRTEMIQNRTDSFEALMHALSKEETPQVVKFKGDYRVFATPYITSTQNTVDGYANGYSQKYYGMMVGASHYFKKSDLNMTLLFGVGATKVQMNSNVASRTTGKSFMTGIVLQKSFFKDLDVETNLSTLVMKNKESRYGQPSPSQSSYVAQSAYNMYALSWRNEVGYVFRLANDYSIKPDIGIQANISQRTKSQEQNVGIYGQSYRAKVSRSGEIYGGVGVRKKWIGDGYEAKLTVKYEVGQRSGNGKANTTVYANDEASSLTYSSNGPGRLTQYLNVYGSFLGTENNWKIVPGITATFQRGQRSLSGVVKIERRF